MTRLLGSWDLERTPAETQREFAQRAHRYMSMRGVEFQAVADVPRQVVEAYYCVRFVRQQLDQETLGELKKGLDTLRALWDATIVRERKAAGSRVRLGERLRLVV